MSRCRKEHYQYEIPTWSRSLSFSSKCRQIQTGKITIYEDVMHTYQCSPGSGGTCQYLPVLAGICQYILVSDSFWLNFFKLRSECYVYFPIFAGFCQSLPVFTGICRCLRVYAGIYRCLPECRVNLPVFSGISRFHPYTPYISCSWTSVRYCGRVGGCMIYLADP